MMVPVYLVTPFIAWLFAGTLKFLINTIRARRLAFDLIGYGGLPSNHGAIVSSVVALIGFREGLSQPAFGAALGMAFIVILDANSLRMQIGKHAAAINVLNGELPDQVKLRERLGHTRVELTAGVVVGVLVAFMSNALFR